MHLSIDVLLLLLTVLLGAALSRVSLCAVAAVQQCVVARDYSGAQRLLIAASAAGIVLLACSAWAPMRVALPAALPISAVLLCGALLLGAGALLNGACYLGSVLYLGNGNMNFLFTLLGIGVGSWAVGHGHDALATLADKSMVPAVLRWTGVVIFAALALLLLLLAGRVRRRTLAWAALAGVVAGLVYARHPGWSYGQVIDALAAGDLSRMSWLANLAALALFAGAIGASGLAGRWQWQRLRTGRALRCLGGGMLMGLGAKLIPGGSDMLLLWSIPGLTLYGAVAYALMLAVLAVLMAGAEIWRRRARDAIKLGP